MFHSQNNFPKQKSSQFHFRISEACQPQGEAWRSSRITAHLMSIEISSLGEMDALKGDFFCAPVRSLSSQISRHNNSLTPLPKAGGRRDWKP